MDDKSEKEQKAYNINNYDNEKINFLSQSENSALLRQIDKSCPTDIINITNNEIEYLEKLWNDKQSTIIPTDLFFAGTIPLMDLEIIVNNFVYRVVIFDNYKSELVSLKTVACVGAIIYSPYADNKEEFIIPINIGIGDYPIFGTYALGDMGFRNITTSHRIWYSSKMIAKQMAQGMMSFLKTWYGIQIALLHPIVKDIFLNPVKIRRNHINDKLNDLSKHSNKKIKYIKRHIVNSEELKNKIYDKSKKHNRHALVWYVTGHWRTYNDGRKTFIQGYFKGALRETKKLSDCREREIITGGEGDNG